jgi:RimJ/RimL family protein N-acetyltransferase
MSDQSDKPPGPAAEAHGPAYRIVTRRLVARCWNPVDAPLLRAAIAASVAHLRPWMAWAASAPEPLGPTVDRLRRARGEFDLGLDFGYGLFDRGETTVLGGSGLHTRAGADAREIGYWIHVDHIGQGLATEAAAALTKVAFLIDHVVRVEIHCDPANLRSSSVPRKLGFVHEATLRQRTQTADGRRRDSMVWSMLRADFAATPVAGAAIEAFDVIGRRLL